MKQFFTKIWSALNGQKRNIGFGLLAAAYVQKFIPAAAPLAPAVPFLYAAGAAMGGVGVAHAIFKSGVAQGVISTAQTAIPVLPPSAQEIAQAVVASLPTQTATAPVLTDSTGTQLPKQLV